MTVINSFDYVVLIYNDLIRYLSETDICTVILLKVATVFNYPSTFVSDDSLGVSTAVNMSRCATATSCSMFDAVLPVEDASTRRNHSACVARAKTKGKQMFRATY